MHFIVTFGFELAQRALHLVLVSDTFDPRTSPCIFSTEFGMAKCEGLIYHI